MFAIFKSTANRDIEVSLDRMLVNCGRMFTLATQSVFGDIDAHGAGPEIWDLDKAVNKGERATRRELLVRGAVRHAEMEQGLLLAYMSVAKDIERIGDYCKNIWDLAEAGVSFGGAPDIDTLRSDTEEVATLLEEGRRAFYDQDEKKVHALIPRMEMVAANHDRIVFQYVGSDEPARVAVPRALYYRFLKRIVSHLENVLTSIVMPLDRIDYYKESKARNPDS